MADEQPTQQLGVEGGEEQDENLNPATRNYQRSRRELEQKFDEARKIAGTINKLKMVLPVTQAAIQFAIAAATTLGPILIILLIVIVVLIAAAAFFIWYRQPARLLKAQGAHDSELWNPENSVDRENLLKVQQAANLISTLQADLATSRQVDGQLAKALAALDKVSDNVLSSQDKQQIRDKLREMQEQSSQIQKQKDQPDHEQRVERFNQLKRELQALTSKLFADPLNRLPVPWRFQPAGSKSCNHYAGFMALLFHLQEQGKYSPEIENRIKPGVVCSKTTTGYMKLAAEKAGLTNIEVVELPHRGPIAPEWNEIKKVVSGEKTGQKTPVVIGTAFSSRTPPRHFLTIVGFGSKAGKEIVYVTDPGSSKAPHNPPSDKNSSYHFIDDPHWSGGKYSKYHYYVFR